MTRGCNPELGCRPNSRTGRIQESVSTRCLNLETIQVARFKIGDTVKLRSGGPVCTINRILSLHRTPASNGAFAELVYFDTQSRKFEMIEFVALAALDETAVPPVHS